ncbi:MAG: hypothetical protein FVQ77_00170 [Cytophagales bacterium]|nr:hypothetical protein [Cytophagales bacterium]
MKPETLEDIKEYKFVDIFKLTSNGTFEPRRAIKIEGLTIYPGQSFRKLGGVDWYDFVSYDIGALERADGILELKGIYDFIK